MSNEQKISKIKTMMDKSEIILLAIEVVTAYKVVDYVIDENIGLPVFTKLKAITYWADDIDRTKDERCLDIYNALFGEETN